MIRRLIRIPRNIPRDQRPLVRDRGQIADLLGSALRRHGYDPHAEQTPARWGFGAITRPLKTAGARLYALEAIHCGSSDPRIANALAHIDAHDLRLEGAMPGWTLDCRTATVSNYTVIPDGSEALNVYCVAPIRLIRYHSGGRREEIVTLADDLDSLINRTMSRRFGRAFHLRALPDRLYLRGRSSISAGFAIKSDDRGRAIVKRGIVLPFTLTGPFEDLCHAWYSGLGRTTGLGFGMLEMAHE